MNVLLNWLLCPKIKTRRLYYYYYWTGRTSVIGKRIAKWEKRLLAEETIGRKSRGNTNRCRRPHQVYRGIRWPHRRWKSEWTLDPVSYFNFTRLAFGPAWRRARARAFGIPSSTRPGDRRTRPTATGPRRGPTLPLRSLEPGRRRPTESGPRTIHVIIPGGKHTYIVPTDWRRKHGSSRATLSPQFQEKLFREC